jgi:hypothetical protein
MSEKYWFVFVTLGFGNPLSLPALAAREMRRGVSYLLIAAIVMVRITTNEYVRFDHGTLCSVRLSSLRLKQFLCQLERTCSLQHLNFE